MNKQNIELLLKKNRKEIKKMGASTIGLFGSFVKNKQNATSDIDLLINFQKGEKTYKNFIRLNFYLEDLFKREVELMTEDSLSPYLKPNILKEVEYVFS